MMMCICRVLFPRIQQCGRFKILVYELEVGAFLPVDQVMKWMGRQFVFLEDVFLPLGRCCLS